MPAKAGIQNHLKILDSRLRGNDAKGGFKTFYETINIERPTSNNVFCLFYNQKTERSDTTLRNSAVRYSIFCGSLLTWFHTKCFGH
jgi:hypothetical protein